MEGVGLGVGWERVGTKDSFLPVEVESSALGFLSCLAF